MANRRYIDFPIASTSSDTDIILIWQDGLNKQTTKATLLSGLPEDLEDLNDVVISGLTNGQILRYNSTTGVWENTDQGNLDLNDLNDVTIVSPSNGQVLVYNSSTSQWENSSGGYVPYIGAVTTVDLGAQQLQAGHTTLTTNGSTETLTINHTSGSGKAINVTKGGAGEGLYVNKTSGSGNAATIVGTLEATTLKKTGGTSSQFLKADGSVDSTTYVPSTRTITINGTSQDLSANRTFNVGTVTSITATAGTGISISGSPITSSGTLTITNTAPDQIVSLTASTGISISGTYPNFTITNTSPSSGGTVTSVTASTPLFSSGGNTPNITIQQASGSQSGFLSSTDWTTFNNKQNALTNPVTGTGTTNYLPKFTGSTTIGNSNIINDASGNFGLGVTPSAWGNTYKVLQFPGGYVGSDSTLVNGLGQNFVWSGSASLYVNNGFACDYYQYLGQHVWRTAPSGTAGNAITFTQAMTLTSGGNLLVGTTSDNGARLQVSGRTQISGGSLDSSTLTDLGIVSALTTGRSGTYQSNSLASISTRGDASSIELIAGVTSGYYTGISATANNASTFAGVLRLLTAGSERMRITSGGDVGISNSNPSTFGGGGLSIGSTSAGKNIMMFSTSAGNNGLIQFFDTNAANAFQISASTTSINLYGYGSRNMIFNTNGTERMRITSGGNVLVASAPSDSTIKLHVKAAQNTDWIAAFDNTGTNPYGLRIDTSANAGSSYSFATYTNVGTGFFVLNDGRVGIGTTSPGTQFVIEGSSSGSGLQDGQMQIRTTVAANASAIGFINTGNTASFNDLAWIRAIITAGSARGSLSFVTRNSDGSNTDVAERMRITSGGYTKASNNGTYFSTTNPSHEFNQSIADWNTQFINTHASVPYGIFMQYSHAPNSTGSEFLYCRDGNGTTVRATIRSNGGIANYQANDANLSDERTKKDIEPLESYWDKFKAIEIVKFKYKDQTHDDFNIGVIAQQVESVAPEFVDVDGWDTKPKLDEEGNEIVSEEEPLKSIYTADLYHATIKVLQEAMSKIEILESEIQTLKQQ